VINEHTIIGNLGRDAEVRYTASGTAVVNFTVATRRSWKDRDSGEWKEETQWHRVVAWGRLAERIGQKWSKGDLVYVKGEHQYSQWEDREGNTRDQSEIRADVCRMLKPKNPDQQPRQNDPRTGNQGQTKGQAGGAPYTDDDIPF